MSLFSTSLQQDKFHLHRCRLDLRSQDSMRSQDSKGHLSLSPRLHQEWGMDPVVIVGPVQHLLWDWIPGPPAKLQQPCSPSWGPHLRGQEPGGAVS